MSVQVDLDELELAMEWLWATRDSFTNSYACVSRHDGKVWWVGEGVEEEPPEDIEDDDAYVAVPDKYDLDLGNDLAVRYAEDHLPKSVDKVEDFFRKRGAWSRFKSYLDSVGHLEKWFDYERAAVEKSLTEWAELNGFSVTRKGAGK